MNAMTQPADVARFRDLVGRRIGLLFEADKSDYLAGVLRERLEASGGCSAAVYLQNLSSGAREEVRALAERLTVAETYFFRYADHFRAFAEVVLPERARVQTGRRRLRILSAGSASGEEAHSLAILVREYLPDLSEWDVELLGVDINPAMVAKAARGRYSAWSLRETPIDVRDRYFHPTEREFQLDDGVRRLVSFEERNLLDDDPSFWCKGAFDVVFCRNVIMYFTPEVVRAVVTRIARALSPGGFLFLGHAETLRGVSQEFHLCHTHDTFYYRLRGESEPATVVRLEQTAVAPSPSARPPLRAAMGLDDSSWVEAIQGASDRVARLTRSRQQASPAVPLPAAAPAEAPLNLEPAVALLRQERFTDAMALLQALPTSSRVDPDAQLLRAVLLTNSGQLAEAERVCRDVLSADELNAGAHYLVALCREHAGDRDGAVEHDQAATYLDPTFAMPHLHLGLLARRAGESEKAQSELSAALGLLAREDASRILLFGGGFSREALGELCRAELRACGARP
jgi:chemotaxis protein methyltransferase CheR